MTYLMEKNYSTVHTYFCMFYMHFNNTFRLPGGAGRQKESHFLCQ